jgi:hypothetical protein
MTISKTIIKDNNFIESPRARRPVSRTSSTNDSGNIIFVESYSNPSELQIPVLDHKVAVQLPVFYNDAMDSNGAGLTPYYSINPMYNYIASEWESTFNGLSPLQSPNIYVENANGLANIKSLAGLTVNRDLAKRFNSKTFRSFSIKPTAVLNRFKNILFLQDYLKNGDKASDKRNYPFYNELFFFHPTNTTIKDKMVEIGIYDLLIEDYATSVKPTREFNGMQIPVFDLKNWIENTDFEISQENKVALSHGSLETGPFAQLLRKIEFKGFLRKQTLEHQRTAAEVTMGKPCHSEVLFHRIRKTKISNGEVVQSFWIPASNERTTLVDTQIRYGEEYEYTHFAYMIVFGAGVNQAVNQVIVSPSIQLVEIPLYSENCLVIQPPQPPPEIQFNNNKNIENEIKISMALNANNYYKNFTPLSPEEAAQDEVVAKYNVDGNKRYFNYETEHALFEIFRMDRQPKRFDEIGEFKIAEIKNGVPSISALYKDKILMDKDYYYVVRSVNTHGLLSNPSPIYKVKQLKDADETFIRVETVGLLEEELEQPNISFQKLLQLVPSSLHTIYDLEKENKLDPTTLKGKIDKVSLGIAEEPIWGKRFKFRITSTDTGKKIDLNIRVKLVTNKTSEDL